MKKNQILKSRYIPYILLVLITFLIGFPLLRERMLEGHDGVFQLFRNYTTKIAIEDKQLIPMVNPDMMGGFGYASNMFYGVLTTYITSFISIFTPTIGSAVNLFILLTVFLSGLFMYTFVKDISEKKTGALLAAVTYMTAPYFLYDIYVRMALGEIASFVFLPLLFHGLYNIIHDRKQKWYLLTIGTAGLFLSHSISTLMAAIFAFFYLLLNYKKVCNKEVLKKISFSLLFAVFISLPTVLPLMEARSSSDYMVFDSAYMKTTGIEMEHNAISLCGSSSKAITGIAKGYFIAVITGFMLSLYLKRKKTSGTQHTQFGILTLISFVFTLDIVPWSCLPGLFSKFQFPWRFLQLSSFFFAITLALLFQQTALRKPLTCLTLLICCCLIFSAPFVNLGIKNPGIDNQLVYSNNLKQRNTIARSTGTASAEYLPRNAIYNYRYLKDRSTDPIILEGKGAIEKTEKNGSHISFKLQAASRTTIELPYIYYPGYSVKADGQTISAFETENGLVGIELEKGNYQITSHYRGSNLMIFAYVTSILSSILFILIVKKEGKNPSLQ